MFANLRLVTILTAINLLTTAGLGWLIYQKDMVEIDLEDLEASLEELAQSNPQFLVSLLNHAANSSAEDDTLILEETIFKNRAEVLKSGFAIKKQQAHSQKALVIFSDMTCPHCIAFLKNVDTALPKLNCSVVIIPISMLGEKATIQAKLITAASLQSAEKAFKLALNYNGSEGAANNMLAEAEKLGLDRLKISQEIDSKAVTEAVAQQTKMAEDSLLPGVPSIFLFTSDQAYFMMPVEAKNLPDLIEHPTREEANEEANENI